MRKAAVPEEQIADALRQAESGTAVRDVCRKLGISEQPCSRWKRTFAGMDVAELLRLRHLEDETRWLKQLVADLTRDRHRLQEVIRKQLSSRLSRSPWWTACASALRGVNGGRAG
jgi:putative transposase